MIKTFITAEVNEHKFCIQQPCWTTKSLHSQAYNNEQQSRAESGCLLYCFIHGILLLHAQENRQKREAHNKHKQRNKSSNTRVMNSNAEQGFGSGVETPDLELAVDEVVVSAHQFQSSLRHPRPDVRVCEEVYQ